MENKTIVHQNEYVTLLSNQNYLVYQTPDLVCVLPVLPNGNLLLIEQYRIPVEQRLLELVTGGINENEEPSIAAVREVKEETGYTVKKVEHVGNFYSAPGYITQKAHVFIAYLDEFVGSALESHEEDFELKNIKISVEEIKNLLLTQTSHPYLSLALHHLDKTNM